MNPDSGHPKSHQNGHVPSVVFSPGSSLFPLPFSNARIRLHLGYQVSYVKHPEALSNDDPFFHSPNKAARDWGLGPRYFHLCMDAISTSLN